ncbi:auxin-responsive protein IAA9-like [Lolium rigidum]|uniref:auxin-responsive protein IAA9-like n=1 Tax=Lolium rigidum TaxID=89674 RepID=UPI001F5DBDCB|nr:auxin-responsive protein IAA9-like [Lolium rigidum]
MELELGLAPPNSTGRLLADRKRGFGEAFEEDAAAPTTLPLFDDGSSSSSNSGGGSIIKNSKKPALVGWPPVSSARSRVSSSGRHVKVRKEGAAIGRKVDVSLHGSYGDLLATLARMFPADQAGCVGTSDEETIADGGRGGGADGLVVTYEDADGDWMLVGDVPWEDFARSVKRLKILL